MDKVKTREVSRFNGKTFGNGHGHQYHRTSWARNDGGRQQEEYGRIEQGFP